MTEHHRSIRPPRTVFIALIFIFILMAIVWGSVTAAVQYGDDYCPNRVGGTGAEACR